MLKAGTGRGQLAFGSDNPPASSNAQFRIFSYTKPHSEVASTTHIPALKGIPKKRFAVFWFTQAERPPTNTAFKNAAKWGTSPGKGNPSPAGRNIPRMETSPPKNKIPLCWQNSITREAQLAGPNRTANPLPEVHGISCFGKITVSPLKLPSRPVSKSCICLRGPSDRISPENRPL